jgi:transcription elongation factor GreA
VAKIRTHLTPEGSKALAQELENLKTVRRREVAAHIRAASEGTGTVDNAEYEEAKNEQAFVEGRIADIERILSDAVVPEIKRGRKKKSAAVQFGSSVTVTNEKGVKRLYRLVGSAEAAPIEGKISESSPVGRALMGHKAGDEVDVETPAGLVKLSINKVA